MWPLWLGIKRPKKQIEETKLTKMQHLVWPDGSHVDMCYILTLSIHVLYLSGLVDHKHVTGAPEASIYVTKNIHSVVCKTYFSWHNEVGSVSMPWWVKTACILRTNLFKILPNSGYIQPFVLKNCWHLSWLINYSMFQLYWPLFWLLASQEGLKN